MGQKLCCLNCGSYETKVVPFSSLPDALKSSNASLPEGNINFHRPAQVELKLARSSLENLSTEISNRSSLATISLGSVQTLSSTKSETVVGERTSGDRQECSPSNKRHPGTVNIFEFSDLILGLTKKNSLSLTASARDLSGRGSGNSEKRTTPEICC